MYRSIAGADWSGILFYAVQFTWGLTVNLAGLAVFLCCRRFPRERFGHSIVTYLPGNGGGLSLGVFIFVSACGAQGRCRLCAHEYGHSIQCLLLGPLYWPVVAVPSVIWCHLFSGFREKHQIAYDAFYCERWATAWGRKWSGE